MKKVLGLDLGTTSIGWAIVNQAENNDEKSSIIRTGVRVNPLSSDEIGSFEKGKAITTNADRTLKRGTRRNLQRYKLRRNNLIEVLKEAGWISDDSILSECGNDSTHQTYKLRAKAAKEEISLFDFAKVLLMINKKRGYKSNRKTVGQEEGHLIDGMAVARQLFEEKITPAQLCVRMMDSGKKNLPEFYRSDLNNEFERIWAFQKQFHPSVLTDEFKEKIANKGKSNISKIFYAAYGIYTAENKGKDRKLQSFKWRIKALDFELSKEELAYVISDLGGEISNSSSTLGAISDRSKELVFSGKTVGEYLYERIQNEPGYSTRNVIFYRQDYIDEFEKLWSVQAQYHDTLTSDLKKRIKDNIIFYQRRLKSQKSLINFCEFENRCRVAPRSSLMFQEFKIWQILNNVEISGPGIEGKRKLTSDEMNSLAQELSFIDKMPIADAFIHLFGSKKGYAANYKTLEGNHTLNAFYIKFFEIINASGHGEYDLKKMSYSEVYDILFSVFGALGFSTAILSFDSTLQKEAMEQQPLFRLWHLLYSYEGDNSNTGDKSLIEKICTICNMPDDYARILSTIAFKDDYASLSNKAISKILPFLKEGNTYDMACLYSGYRHSKNSLTTEEIQNKRLVDHLENLQKNSLRNPVVEKILNQMVNVVNAISEEYGKPDEIHIELARSLKQSTSQREKATQDIADSTKESERITKILQQEFNIPYVRKTDILRYRLYEELKFNGYKTLYSNTYIPREELFSSDKIDIEHIIPQALLFNDSFGNKTLEFKDVNIAKGRMTANDYVASLGDEKYKEYVLRVENLFKQGAISKTKRANLLMAKKDIPEDFVARDLTCSQYIAKYAKEMLESYVRYVIPTSGSITERLRREWQLVDIMKELSINKYRAAGKTFFDGNGIEKIEDWTKRNDHRHHAMDALTIAFTTPAHIKTLNTLAARDFDDWSALLPAPMPLKQLRSEFKKNIDETLVSIKAKNKVVTKNINKTKCKDGTKSAICLTPRGALHKEQVYGQRHLYETFEIAVGSKLTAELAESIASAQERARVQAHLAAFGNDPKKAFNKKNLPEDFPTKVKCVRFKTVYSIRKSIDESLSVDKVMDNKIREILKNRIEEFGGDQKKAFSNLAENPIWLNRDKGIQLKKVTISEPFDLNALHSKVDKNGQIILDNNGNPIPSDFVNLRNNHHIAIYRDSEGNLQESVVSFFEALNRITAGLPAVDKNFRKEYGWEFLFTMKINEMFVFPDPTNGFNPGEIDLCNPENYALISPHLFRVQALSNGDYRFRHHLETVLNGDKVLQNITWKRICAPKGLDGIIKVRINHIGKIVSIGEYD